MNFSNDRIQAATSNQLVIAVQDTGLIDYLVSVQDRNTWITRLKQLRTDMFQQPPDQPLSQTINHCLRSEYAQLINRLAEHMGCREAADLDAVISQLRLWVEAMPVVSLTTATDLNREHWLRVRDWITHHLDQTVIIEAHQDPAIGAGAIIHWRGHQYNGAVLKSNYIPSS